jgi:ornithine cyclodeaminase/alanine dehydrogenase-like protein (mu-crystallin family)
LILNNDEIAQVFDMQKCLEVLEEAYRELGEGRGVIRPRVHSFMGTPIPDTLYLFKSMEGGLEKSGIMALRISSEHHRRMEAYGKLRRFHLPAPPHNKFLGLILLFSTETTEILAITPDGYIQSQRVGATWALGAKYLARKNCQVIGMYGGRNGVDLRPSLYAIGGQLRMLHRWEDRGH